MKSGAARERWRSRLTPALTLLVCVTAPVTLAALLLYRVVYYVLPLIVAGRAFPRPGARARGPMGPRWLSAIGAVLLVELWVALLAYRHVHVARETWWRFALYGHAPRVLRAALGASVVILLMALARLLAPGQAGGEHATQL